LISIQIQKTFVRVILALVDCNIDLVIEIQGVNPDAAVAVAAEDSKPCSQNEIVEVGIPEG
jgi:hypothetical protein